MNWLATHFLIHFQRFGFNRAVAASAAGVVAAPLPAAPDRTNINVAVSIVTRDRATSRPLELALQGLSALRLRFRCALAACLLLLAGFPAGAATVDDVKMRGFLICGVSDGLAGLSAADTSGVWSGLDVDFCKAVSAAVLGEVGKLRYRPLRAQERFKALTTGEIDLLARNITWTMERDASREVSFAGIIYHDGQGLMIRKELGLTSVLELSASKICLTGGTAAEQHIQAYFGARKMPFTPVVLTTSEDTAKAYDAKHCDALTGDMTALAAQRLTLAVPGDHMILPEVVSKSPLSPVIRGGDEDWGAIVRLVLFALINAEELGVNSGNVDAALKSELLSVRRLLGGEAGFGEALGLPADWAYQVIRQVGNYGEIFDRNLGKDSVLGLRRGLNNLWSNGGILFAPPIQ